MSAVRFSVIEGTSVERDLALRAQVVVVGSGAGGAVAACELASGGLDVVVLEQGSYVPADRYTAEPVDMMTRLYADGGATAAIGRPGVGLPFARLVGGTTVINSGTCFRLPATVVGKWARTTGADLTVDSLAPLFDEIEKDLSIAPADWELIGRYGHRIADGARKLGFHPKPLNRNAKGCLGCGVCAFGCPQDAKLAMHVSYLPRAVERGARLYADCRAERLIFEGNRAAGVEATVFDRDRGRVHRLVVRSGLVILAGGALGSAVFLRRNGIRGKGGDAGRHLVLHPATKVIGLFDEDLVPWEGIPQSLYIDDLTAEGIMFEGASMPPEFGSIGVPLFGREHRAVMERYRSTGIFGIMITDASEGSVAARGWRTIPLYSVGKEDAKKTVRAIKVLGEITFAAGAREILTPIHGLGRLRSMDELRAIDETAVAPDRIEYMAFHPAGTCRMGADPGRSVVGPMLESHQVPRLFVTDASVFPSSPGVNPQETIMALAMRTARHILSHRARYA